MEGDGFAPSSLPCSYHLGSAGKGVAGSRRARPAEGGPGPLGGEEGLGFYALKADLREAQVPSQPSGFFAHVILRPHTFQEHPHSA